MATATIDPQTLTSWEDAFTTYPLPAVRRLETQLRRNVADKRDRLRALVGASYRDLLGTAERIIAMDAQIGDVERGLGELGRRCNARAVQRGAENYGRLENGVKWRDSGVERVVGGEEGRLEVMARTKVLQLALGVAARTIKGGADPLLAAKLLILSRLLHKSVVESGRPPAILEDLRRKLGLLRKKLLAYVDRSLVGESNGREFLIHTLCAYALVTSSAPKDVMRHFLDVRSERINEQCASAKTSSIDQVMSVLDVYGQTLTDARDLFPRRFADAMADIAKSPLLHGSQLRDIPALSLDIYDCWIPDSVRSFTPYIRHDQLTTPDVTRSINTWAKEAQRSLLEGLKQHLSMRSEVASIVDARAAYITKYAQLAQRSRVSDHLSSLHEVRKMFLDRLHEVGVQSAMPHESLRKIETLEWQEDTTAKRSLWDLSEHDFDLDNGAVDLRRHIVRMRHGHDSSVDQYTSLLTAWLEDINTYFGGLKAMRSQKWDVDFDLDFDAGDDGDEEDENDLQRIMNKEDPSSLQSALKAAVANALGKVYAALAAADVVGSDTAATLIRIVREVDATRIQLGGLFEIQFNEGASPSFIMRLHHQIASHTIQEPVQRYRSTVQQKLSPAVSLWDGTPPLPVQPSPATFTLLSDIQHGMSAGDADGWSPAAVGVLKRELQTQLADMLERSDALNGGADEATGNGQADDGDGSVRIPGKPSENDRLVQLSFDLKYLQRALTVPGADTATTGIAAAVKQLKSKTNLDNASYDRLTKNAESYWRRTFLLFGLLAPGTA